MREGSTVKFTILDGRKISPELADTWRELQRGNPDLSSPFFCPEFTLAVAAAREDVRIAVIEDKGSVAGIFPFQIDRQGFGKPVGAGIADYQGMICSPGFSFDATDLLRACGLIAWDFDHLVVGQEFLSRFRREIQPSPLIDLTHGFASYIADRRSAGSELISEIRNKSRRLERDAGKIAFVANTFDVADFRRVLSWKSAQFVRTTAGDVVATPWVSNTLDLIRTQNTHAFAGITSILYAGDTPIAGHYGMRSSSVWHWWFTAYAPEYHRYSPGSILLYKMAEAASDMGLCIIDLGKGQARYKDRFKNRESLLAEGSVERGSLLKLSRNIGRGIRATVEHTALEKPAQQLIWALRQSRFRGLYEFFASGPRRVK